MNTNAVQCSEGAWRTMSQTSGNETKVGEEQVSEDRGDEEVGACLATRLAIFPARVHGAGVERPALRRHRLQSTPQWGGRRVPNTRSAGRPSRTTRGRATRSHEEEREAQPRDDEKQEPHVLRGKRQAEQVEAPLRDIEEDRGGSR